MSARNWHADADRLRARLERRIVIEAARVRGERPGIDPAEARRLAAERVQAEHAGDWALAFAPSPRRRGRGGKGGRR